MDVVEVKSLGYGLLRFTGVCEGGKARTGGQWDLFGGDGSSPSGHMGTKH